MPALRRPAGAVSLDLPRRGLDLGERVSVIGLRVERQDIVIDRHQRRQDREMRVLPPAGPSHAGFEHVQIAPNGGLPDGGLLPAERDHRRQLIQRVRRPAAPRGAELVLPASGGGVVREHACEARIGPHGVPVVVRDVGEVAQRLDPGGRIAVHRLGQRPGDMRMMVRPAPDRPVRQGQVRQAPGEGRRLVAVEHQCSNARSGVAVLDFGEPPRLSRRCSE